MKGKVQDNQNPSRLCKYSMFVRWYQLAMSFNISTIERVDKVTNVYSEAKQGSTRFQTAKKTMFKAFAKAELGDWIKKPMEQDDFEL